MDAEWKAHLDAEIGAARRSQAQWARERRRYLRRHPRALWAEVKVDVQIGIFVVCGIAVFLLAVWAVKAVAGNVF